MTDQGEHSVSDVSTAVARGDHKALAKALESGADPNSRDRRGGPVLGLAAARGDLGSVRLLLERGADPNLVSEVGNSPLMIAAARGRLDVARALLEAGAKSNATNSWGLSAVDWAQWANDPAEMRALIAEHREHA